MPVRAIFLEVRAGSAELFLLVARAPWGLFIGESCHTRPEDYVGCAQVLN